MYQKVWNVIAIHHEIKKPRMFASRLQVQEQAKAQMQQTVARLTDACWEKCIGTPGRATLKSFQMSERLYFLCLFTKQYPEASKLGIVQEGVSALEKKLV